MTILTLCLSVMLVICVTDVISRGNQFSLLTDFFFAQMHAYMCVPYVSYILWPILDSCIDLSSWKIQLVLIRWLFIIVLSTISLNYCIFKINSHSITSQTDAMNSWSGRAEICVSGSPPGNLSVQASGLVKRCLLFSSENVQNNALLLSQTSSLVSSSSLF